MIDPTLSYASIYTGLRGGVIHTMSLAATRGTGAQAEALRCTGRAYQAHDLSCTW